MRKKGELIEEMSYTTVFSYGHKSNMVREIVVDNFSDIATIDISQLKPGSTAFVIKTSQTYMLSNEYKWEKVSIGASSSNTGTGDDDEINREIIYDGGDDDNPNSSSIYYDGGDDDGN